MTSTVLPSPAVTSRKGGPPLGLPARERVKINEIFYSIQGESTAAGLPCVLVRLTGCQMRCVWCDSEYSFYQGDWRSLDAVLATVAGYGCPLVEVTGGEPLLQPGAEPLMVKLCDAGYEVLLETGGGVDLGGVDPRVRRIVDVKCPDSGEAANNRWTNLELLTERDELKFVVASEADYRWARAQVRKRALASLCPVHFSPVMPVSQEEHAGSARPSGIEPRQLAEWILKDRLPVRLSLQLHKFLWPDQARGV